jgi:hypothetical protein
MPTLEPGESRWKEQPDGSLRREASDQAPQPFGPGLHRVVCDFTRDMAEGQVQIRDSHGQVVLEVPLVATDDYFRDFRAEYQLQAPPFKPGEVYDTYMKGTDRNGIGSAGAKKGQTVVSEEDRSIGKGKPETWSYGASFVFRPDQPNDNVAFLPVSRDAETLRAFRQKNTLAMEPTAENYEKLFGRLLSHGGGDPLDEKNFHDDTVRWFADHASASTGAYRHWIQDHPDDAAKLGFYLPSSAGISKKGLLYRQLWTSGYMSTPVREALQEQADELSSAEISTLRSASKNPVAGKVFWDLLAARVPKDQDAADEIRWAWILDGEQGAEEALVRSCDPGNADAIAFSFHAHSNEEAVIDYCSRCQEGSLPALHQALGLKANVEDPLPRTLGEMAELDDAQLLARVMVASYNGQRAYETNAITDLARSRKPWLLRREFARHFRAWLGPDVPLAAERWLERGERHPWVQATVLGLLDMSRPKSKGLALEVLASSDPLAQIAALQCLSQTARDEKVESRVLELLERSPRSQVREAARAWLLGGPLSGAGHDGLLRASSFDLEKGQMPRVRPASLTLSAEAQLSASEEDYRGYDLLNPYLVRRSATRVKKKREPVTSSGSLSTTPETSEENSSPTPVPLVLSGETEAQRTRRLAKVLATKAAEDGEAYSIAMALSRSTDPSVFDVLLEALDRAEGPGAANLWGAIGQLSPKAGQADRLVKVLEKRVFRSGGPHDYKLESGLAQVAKAQSVSVCQRLLEEELSASAKAPGESHELRLFAQALDRVAASGPLADWRGYDDEDPSRPAPSDRPSAELLLGAARKEPALLDPALQYLRMYGGDGAASVLAGLPAPADPALRTKVWDAYDDVITRHRGTFALKADATFIAYLRHAWKENPDEATVLKALARASLNDALDARPAQAFQEAAWLSNYVSRLHTPEADRLVRRLAEETLPPRSRRALVRCVDGRDSDTALETLRALLKTSLGETVTAAMEDPLAADVAAAAASLSLTALGPDLLVAAEGTQSSGLRKMSRALGGFDFPKKAALLREQFERAKDREGLAIFDLRSLGPWAPADADALALVTQGLGDWRPQVRDAAYSCVQKLDKAVREDWIKGLDDAKRKAWGLAGLTGRSRFAEDE